MKWGFSFRSLAPVKVVPLIKAKMRVPSMTKNVRSYCVNTAYKNNQMFIKCQMLFKQMISALDKLKEDLQRLNNQIHADSYRAKPAQIVGQIW